MRASGRVFINTGERSSVIGEGVGDLIANNPRVARAPVESDPKSWVTFEGRSDVADKN